MLIFVSKKDLKKKKKPGEVEPLFLFVTNFLLELKKLFIKYEWLYVALTNQLLLIIVLSI